jgi:hypothetical protein
MRARVGRQPREREPRSSASRCCLGVRMSVPLLLLAACQNAGHDRVLGISATSEVEGLAYFDANRSLSFDSSDVRMQGLKVYLTTRGTLDTVAASTSDATGQLKWPGVPVGSYDVLVDQTSAGDTVVVLRVDSSQIDLAPGDTVAVSVGVSFPLVTVAEARTTPVGKKVFVSGVALTNTNVFADTTANLEAATGSLRLVRVFSGLFSPGDSLLARGTVSSRDGEPVLRDVSVLNLGFGTLAPPDSLSTFAVAGADGGVLDAGLARTTGTLQDTVTVGRDRALDVDDGSGPLRVLLDGDVSFQLSPYLINPLRVIATGVLVPSATAGTWYLKPRSNLDVTFVVNVSSTGQVRQQPVGTRVFVDGVALIRPNLFGDSTLHLADSAGAIRVTNSLQSSIQASDSIRVAGTVTTRDGQPVLTNPTIFRLGLGTIPNALPVRTGEAASATSAGLNLDARLVRVGRDFPATIQDTSRVGGDFRAVVDDGTGSVTVVLDVDVYLASYNVTNWAPGAAVDVSGVLVPDGGSWVVKPRGVASDIVKP